MKTTDHSLATKHDFRPGSAFTNHLTIRNKLICSGTSIWNCNTEYYCSEMRLENGGSEKAASDSQTDHDFYYNDVTGLASSR